MGSVEGGRHNNMMITTDFIMIEYHSVDTSMMKLYCVQKIGPMKSKKQRYLIHGY